MMSSATSETSPLIGTAPKATSLSRWTKYGLCSFTLVSLAVLSYFMSALLLPELHVSPPLRTPDAVREWSWDDIQPSTKLTWHKCYDHLDCARLEVPLDWLEPRNGSTMAIAVMRKNATSTVDYKGPLFVNPGGPGGSGVQIVQGPGGVLFQTLVGANYVGATTPQMRCFRGPKAEALAGLQKPGTIDSHPGVIFDKYAHQKLLNRNCEENIGDVARFVGTASVARDMLEINDQLGYEKLAYWGLSYGTVLGGTFAAMFPDRVGRMVNDGNVNYAEWYNRTEIHFCEDTDKVMSAFFDLCAKAGSSECEFYEPTAAAVEKRLDDLYEHLRKYPLIVERNATSKLTANGESITQRSLVTYSDVKSAVIAALYQPFLNFPLLGKIFRDLEHGDGISFLKRFGRPEFNCCDASGDCVDDYWQLEAVGNGDADLFVRCGETMGDSKNDTIEALLEYNESIQELSPVSGPVMFDTPLVCSGWRPRAKWIFKGPFKRNTSHPILFIGNTADNITPLSSAISNAKNFNGSSVLIQNSYGHTSTSNPSTCTAAYRLAYFQNGTLPTNGTLCEPDVLPFGVEVKGTVKRTVKENDDELRRAMMGVMGITLNGKGWA